MFLQNTLISRRFDNGVDYPLLSVCFIKIKVEDKKSPT